MNSTDFQIKQNQSAFNATLFEFEYIEHVNYKSQLDGALTNWKVDCPMAMQDLYKITEINGTPEKKRGSRISSFQHGNYI